MFAVDQPSPLVLLWFTRKTTTNNKIKKNKHKRKAKRAAGFEWQVATMVGLHTRLIDTTDTTTMKRARIKMKKKITKRRQNKSAALGRPAMKIREWGRGGGLQLVCGRPTLALSSALVPQAVSVLACVDDS